MKQNLRSQLIRLAHANPELRQHLLPLVKTAGIIDTGEEMYRRTLTLVREALEATETLGGMLFDARMKAAVGRAVRYLRQAFNALHDKDFDSLIGDDYD